MNNKSKAAENERTKRITTAKTLQAAEDELTKAKADLIVAIRERDSASAGLASAQKQAEDQTKRLLEAEDQLQIAKDLIEDLSKKLAAAEHDKRVAEYAREEALRAKQEAEFGRKPSLPEMMQRLPRKQPRMMVIMRGWLKPKPPLKPRFLEYAGFIAPRFGKRH